MSKFFESKKEVNKVLIPPDYSDIKSSDDDDDIEDECIVDEGALETILDENIVLPKKETTSPFKKETNESMSSMPWQTSSNWQPGGGSSSQKTTDFWENNSPSNFGSIGSSNNSYGSYSFGKTNSPNNGNNQCQIDRNKRVIICDFLDCIVETYQSQGKPGLIPRDIYDLKPKFDVWEKIRAFNPDLVFAMIPKNLIPGNTNGVDCGWNTTLGYFCCCLSSYLRLQYQNCQIIAQTQIGQPKEDILLSIFNNNPQIQKTDSVYIGIYSGLSGQSDMDSRAANNIGIDYIDLGQLLTIYS